MRNLTSTDHEDHSRWQAFVREFAEGFNAPVLKQMHEDIREIEQGMEQYVRPIVGNILKQEKR